MEERERREGGVRRKRKGRRRRRDEKVLSVSGLCDDVIAIRERISSYYMPLRSTYQIQ
jgi:hypothetical protein